MISEDYAYAYCKEDLSKIENYEEAVNDKSKTWVCHHRTEIWWDCSAKELKDAECYYNRPAKELIFLTRGDHVALHHTGKHRVFTDEWRRNISKAHLGTKRPKSVCDKISRVVKGHKYTLVDGVRVRNKEAG